MAEVRKMEYIHYVGFYHKQFHNGSGHRTEWIELLNNYGCSSVLVQGKQNFWHLIVPCGVVFLTEFVCFLLLKVLRFVSPVFLLHLYKQHFE